MAGKSKYSEKKPGAYHILELINYVLGNTQTVDEAVAFIKTNAFYTTADFANFAPGITLTLHFAITDASGRSVVVEFINGKAVIHENKVGAMTNDPQYEEQLKNWSKYAGKPFNEDTFEAFDLSSKGKFCRMAAMNATQAKVPTDIDAVNRAWSMINMVDLPQGVLYWRWVSENPQFTSYAVVDDLKNRVYYFRTYDNYDIRKIDLSKIDFATANTGPFPCSAQPITRNSNSRIAEANMEANMETSMPSISEARHTAVMIPIPRTLRQPTKRKTRAKSGDTKWFLSFPGLSAAKN